MKAVIFFSFLFILSYPSVSLAHPGRTDASGCHTCRTNCASWGLSTGEYHCHQSKGIPQPIEPVRSIRAESVTVPAPEYAQPKAVVPMVVKPTPSPVAKKIVATTTPKVNNRVSTSTGGVKTIVRPEGFTKSWFSRFTSIFR